MSVTDHVGVRSDILATDDTPVLVQYRPTSFTSPFHVGSVESTYAARNSLGPTTWRKFHG